MQDSNLDDFKTREVDTQIAKKSVRAGEEVVLDEDTKDAKNLDRKNNGQKKKINKKVLIAIIAILIVVVIAIIFLVLGSSEDEVIVEDGEADLLVSVTDTYEGLNYTMTEQILEEQGYYYDYSKAEEGNKVYITYISVDGLKDEELETKINETLKSTVEDMYDTDNLLDSTVLYDKIYNYTDVYIFNNVLSTMYCEEKCYTDGTVEYIYTGVNINLKDYEEFTLSDVFISSTDIESIIEDQAPDITYTDEIIFSVSPKNVYLVDEEGNIDTINLYENRDLVAIYKRYYTQEKMFESTYSASPYVFTTKRFFVSDVYGLEEDNLFIDTCDTLVDNTTYSDGVIDAAQEVYKEAVNKAKNISYSNPSKRYIVQIVSDVIENSDGTYSAVARLYSYEIEKNFFTESIEEFIVASENVDTQEYAVATYFDTDIMDSTKYLQGTSSQIFTKVVDEDGNEIAEEETETQTETTNTQKDTTVS